MARKIAYPELIRPVVQGTKALCEFWIDCRCQIGKVQPGAFEFNANVFPDRLSNDGLIKGGMKRDQGCIPDELQKIQQCPDGLRATGLGGAANAVNQDVVLAAGRSLLQNYFKAVVKRYPATINCHGAYGNQFVPGWAQTAGFHIHHHIAGSFDGSTQIRFGQGLPAIKA